MALLWLILFVYGRSEIRTLIYRDKNYELVQLATCTLHVLLNSSTNLKFNDSKCLTLHFLTLSVLFYTCFNKINHVWRLIHNLQQILQYSNFFVCVLDYLSVWQPSKHTGPLKLQLFVAGSSKKVYCPPTDSQVNIKSFNL